MAVLYTVIEDDGTEHNRYSVGHAEVLVPNGGKGIVKYCSRIDLAEATLRQSLAERFGKRGGIRGQPAFSPVYPEAKLYPVTARIT